MRDVPFNVEDMDYWQWVDHKGAATVGVRRLVDPERDRRRDAVQDAIGRLPALNRAILNALFYEGLSKRETARQLGISRVTVDRRLKLVLARLGEVLRDETL